MKENKYTRELLDFLIGDKSVKGFYINYLTGPKIIELGDKYNFNEEYPWNGGALSRWQYMEKLINHFVMHYSIEEFFGHYINKNIAPYNTAEELSLYLNELTRQLKFNNKDIVIDENGQVKIIDASPIEETGESRLSLMFGNFSDMNQNQLVESGGFCQIFTSDEYKVLRKKLMIKIETTEKDKERFREEFRLMEKIANPQYILEVRDFSEENLSYKMPEGKTLSAEIVNMSDFDILSLISHLIMGLNYIHNNNVFHRDISGSNILKVNNYWVYSDFGISKSIINNGQSLTTTGTMFGKEKYIHPDLYSDYTLWKNGYKFDYDIYALMTTFKEEIIPHIENYELRMKVSNIFSNINNWEELVKAHNENLTKLISEENLIKLK